jgi:hypothetical protein
MMLTTPNQTDSTDLAEKLADLRAEHRYAVNSGERGDAYRLSKELREIEERIQYASALLPIGA